MEHDPSVQKQYFQFAYQTGSDIWSHLPYRYKAQQMLPSMEKDSLVLDIGAGRGLWAMNLAKMGFRVLGIDYVDTIVQKVNKTIHEEGYGDRVRFVTADALDIPFVDKGFKMVTDVGTLQHITSDKWHGYAHEMKRVLSDDGYYLKISLSRRTNKFMGWSPRTSDTGDFTKFGVHYHFFTETEIEEIFQDDFTIIDQQFETYGSTSDPGDEVVLVFTLMKKK